MSYIGAQPSQVAFVTDQFTGDGATTQFTMSVAPANTASVLVSITGVLQDPSAYAVTGNTLTFSAAPPAGASNISVRYLGVPASGVTTTAYRTITEFTATAGQTTFNIPSYTVGYINVFRNGVRLGTADFTASNGTSIILQKATNLNDLVVCESFFISSALNAIPNSPGSIQTGNLSDGSITYSKIQSIASAKVLGRDTSGAGVVQELPIAVDSSGNVTLSGAVKVQATNSNLNLVGASNVAGVTSFDLIQAGDSAAYIFNRANSPMIFGVNNATQLRLEQSGDLKFNSGYGSVATAYGCRAWVNYNCWSTAFRGSGNVTSMTKNATGDYTVNFTNAMPDANYSIVGTVNNQNTNGILVAVSSTAYNGSLNLMSTTQVRIITNNVSSLYDMTLLSLAVFR